MPKVLRCKDVGMECDWEGHAHTTAELLAQMADHARKVHHMTEIPPEVMEKAKAAIKDE
jgi:predicted small metal-binding protein